MSEDMQRNADLVASPSCHHNVDRMPGWVEIAFLPKEKYVVQWCHESGWHVFHYDEQAAQTPGPTT